MRRILVDKARRRESLKRGGTMVRVDLPEHVTPAAGEQFDLLALDDALRQLESLHPDKARLVKLRFFAGCSLEDSAEYMGISRATAQRDWAYARGLALRTVESRLGRLVWGTIVTAS